MTHHQDDSAAAAAAVARALSQLGSKGVRIDARDGLSDEEIAEVARAQGATSLPTAYLTFLRTIGRGSGRFARGMDLFYPEVLTVRAVAQELLEEMGDATLLKPGDFVFSQNQGYQFLYFQASDPESRDHDPAVWLYSDGAPGKVRKYGDAFSDFVQVLVEDYRNNQGDERGAIE